MHAAIVKPDMELDEEGKELVQQLCSSINSAVEKSPRVLDAIEQLREAGYVMDLTIRLEIALRKKPFEEKTFNRDDVQLDLTSEDLRTLKQMGIRIDDDM